jgi:hypothetical protein
MLRKHEKNKMLRKKLVGVLVAIAMLGTMVASAASSTSTPTVVGNGTITKVVWQPSPIMSIPSGTGATINLSAPGKLQILYNGTPIVVGKDGNPYNITPGVQASFNGTFLSPTPIIIPYKGVATVVTPPPVINQWTLFLTFPTYPGQSVTLYIDGPLSIPP